MKLQEIYNQIPTSKCPDNCGKCCGPVYPSKAEIRNIEQWCRQHGIEFKNQFGVESGVDCPYLKENSCSIYPVRPFMCRTFGVVEHPLLRCPNCKTKRLLNIRQMDYLYKQIYKGEEKRIQKHAAKVNEFLKEQYGEGDK
jgi:hypothetical protein